jgi:hypothetical protein
MPSSDRDVREYAAVYGCVRALTIAVVAVTVAVRDTGRPSALQAGSGVGGVGLVGRPTRGAFMIG